MAKLAAKSQLPTLLFVTLLLFQIFHVSLTAAIPLQSSSFTIYALTPQYGYLQLPFAPFNTNA